jgi:hypothetical protein
VTILDASGYVVLAVIYLITYFVIVARHAIPLAPHAFHVALTVPMLGGGVLLFLLAALVRTGSGALFGMDTMFYVTAFVWSHAAWMSILLFYSYWWYMHGRNKEAEQFDRIEKKLDDAASERTGDRPMEETDRAEGRKHRADIEDRMDDAEGRLDENDKRRSE